MKRPLSTIVFIDGIKIRRGSGWFIRLACNHEVIVHGKQSPRCGDAHPCASCANLRSARADRELRRLIPLGLEPYEVEYIAGRLQEAIERARVADEDRLEEKLARKT